MKNYYQILGVEPDVDGSTLRTRYRTLAMRYHPDRNPNDPEAANTFKEIAEAYGVLSDPVKRKSFDDARAGKGPVSGSAPGGFSFSQEDILRDLFRDPRFQTMLQGLLREFRRSGFRAGPHFIKKIFFGGKGGLFFGGFFLFSSLLGPALLKSAGKNLPGTSSFIKRLSTTVGGLLGFDVKKQATSTRPTASRGSADITYVTIVSRQELREGKTIQVATSGPDGQEMLEVKIPPGSYAGQKLRLRGKGAHGPRGRGDLYLLLQLP